MHEDDYTGSQIEDDDELALIEGTLGGVFDIDIDDDASIYVGDDENETVIDVRTVANGSKSLQEIAERLYDLADELLELAGEGWEILDDVTHGQGIAVRFDVDESIELETTDG